jgi:hypothetical protein
MTSAAFRALIGGASPDCRDALFHRRLHAGESKGRPDDDTRPGRSIALRKYRLPANTAQHFFMGALTTAARPFHDKNIDAMRTIGGSGSSPLSTPSRVLKGDGTHANVLTRARTQN